MYPMKFEKILKEKVWGGDAFEEKLSITIPKKKSIGESWEVSCRGEEISVVVEGELKGKGLLELLSSYKEKLVGEEVYKKYGNTFPLLIKYLDINDKLSVQVHPDDNYALLHEKDFGKKECWYIMEASSDAKLIMGLKKGISKEIFEKKIKEGDFSDLFNTIKVMKGDFISINPGMVHASLEGSILICEPQQNSDSTYRIYDFDRVVDGEKRPLHLEKAIDVIDFSAEPIVSSNTSREKIFFGKNVIEKMEKNEFFKVDKLIIAEEYNEKLNENFIIYNVIEGEGDIVSNGNYHKIKKGETFFIPAKLQVKLIGNLEIIKTYI